jgi:hypothetical protein
LKQQIAARHEGFAESGDFPDSMHRECAPGLDCDRSGQSKKCICKQGEGEGSAIDGNRLLAISIGFLAIQMAQEQFADWSHRYDALERTLELQLDIVSTDASIPVWFHLRRACGEWRDL